MKFPFFILTFFIKMLNISIPEQKQNSFSGWMLCLINFWLWLDVCVCAFFRQGVPPGSSDERGYRNVGEAASKRHPHRQQLRNLQSQRTKPHTQLWVRRIEICTRRCTRFGLSSAVTFDNRQSDFAIKRSSFPWTFFPFVSRQRIKQTVPSQPRV